MAGAAALSLRVVRLGAGAKVGAVEAPQEVTTAWSNG